ncbi:MAG TPA: S16 family serine protease, partial [Terriglobia bacterium]|nr:S16 family serine protease [Terriglobia bacterium]
KVLAAKRAGIDTVILPERNRKDVEEIPAKIRRSMRFHYVRFVEEALPIAMGNGRLEKNTTPATGKKRRPRRKRKK